MKSHHIYGWSIIVTGTLLVFPVMAATTGTLTLSGTVAPSYAITITPNAAATSLDIAGGETNTQVAVVNEQANSDAGYVIRISSATDGYLAHDTIGTEKVAYTVRYGGGGAVAPTTVSQVFKTSGALSSPANVNSTVTISFSGRAGAASGIYSDTLTFEIAAP